VRPLAGGYGLAELGLPDDRTDREGVLDGLPEENLPDAGFQQHRFEDLEPREEVVDVAVRRTHRRVRRGGVVAVAQMRLVLYEVLGVARVVDARAPKNASIRPCGRSIRFTLVARTLAAGWRRYRTCPSTSTGVPLLSRSTRRSRRKLAELIEGPLLGVAIEILVQVFHVDLAGRCAPPRKAMFEHDHRAESTSSLRPRRRRGTETARASLP